MTAVSKLGIQCPSDNEDHFVCRLSYIGKYRRNNTTFEDASYNPDRHGEGGMSARVIQE
jgi:hypothetical protein